MRRIIELIRSWFRKPAPAVVARKMEDGRQTVRESLAAARAAAYRVVAALEDAA